MRGGGCLTGLTLQCAAEQGPSVHDDLDSDGFAEGSPVRQSTLSTLSGRPSLVNGGPS